MTSISSTLEALLTKKEIEYETEAKRVEAMLAECGHDKVQPARDYWHRLDLLRRQVNALRALTESPLE